MEYSKAYKERYTVPVINKLQFNRVCYNDYINGMINFRAKLRDAQKIHNLDLVGIHKQFLGKQSYCWTGYKKYWVWDFGEWRVYINNIEGIGIEVSDGASIDRTMEIVKEYWSKLQ
jgi:hypothetical protein